MDIIKRQEENKNFQGKRGLLFLVIVTLMIYIATLIYVKQYPAILKISKEKESHVNISFDGHIVMQNSQKNL